MPEYRLKFYYQTSISIYLIGDQSDITDYLYLPKCCHGNKCPPDSFATTKAKGSWEFYFVPLSFLWRNRENESLSVKLLISYKFSL